MLFPHPSFLVQAFAQVLHQSLFVMKALKSTEPVESLPKAPWAVGAVEFLTPQNLSDIPLEAHEQAPHHL